MMDSVNRSATLAVTDVNHDNIERFIEAGTDLFIVGQSLFNEDDYYTAIAKLRKRVVDSIEFTPSSTAQLTRAYKC